MTSVALVFPGQGSQSDSMLSDYAGLAEVAGAFAEASEVLGVDLGGIVACGEELSSTVRTQPILLAAGVGIWRAWLACGGAAPTCAAGHSVGEYAALVAAGSLSLADAVEIVAERAQAMQEVMPAGKGAMLAVLGIDAETIAQCCEETGEVWIANLNAPFQTVISGRTDAVTAAAQLCAARGAKRLIKLPVSVPSHCPLMKLAADRLTEKLAQTQFLPPKFSVVHNAGTSESKEPYAVRELLAKQLCAQVDWIACVKKMAAAAEIVIECGPGKVLHNLNRRIIGRQRCAALDGADAVRKLAAETG